MTLVSRRHAVDALIEDLEFLLAVRAGQARILQALHTTEHALWRRLYRTAERRYSL